MAIQCSVEVPEVEVKFPAVMENRTLESRTLIINEDIGIDDRKGVIDLRKHNFLFDTCPPGSKFVIELVAEDGREYPRIEENSFMSCNWLCLDVSPGGRSMGIQVKGIDRNIGIYSDTINCKPLPTGTKTTITFCDGKWTCEIVEPEKDWLPVDLGDGLRFERAIHDRATVRCHSVPIGINPAKSRELSEVAARFADEQEFPEESFPMEYRHSRLTEYTRLVGIGTMGELHIGTSVNPNQSTINSAEEAEFIERAMRQYRRHLEASK